MAAAKKTTKTTKPTPAKLLAGVKRSGRVISVYGPFNARTMIEVPTDLAAQVLGVPLERFARTNVIEAVEADLEAIRKRAPEVADSALAATAIQLAYEMENPFNSATSKSMCARSLIEILDGLAEKAPPTQQETSQLDDLRAKREARIAGGAAAAD